MKTNDWEYLLDLSFFCELPICSLIIISKKECNHYISKLQKLSRPEFYRNYPPPKSITQHIRLQDMTLDLNERQLPGRFDLILFLLPEYTDIIKYSNRSSYIGIVLKEPPTISMIPGDNEKLILSKGYSRIRTKNLEGYYLAIFALKNHFSFYCESELAVNSYDYKHPLGTRQDNRSNTKFVDRCTQLFPQGFSLLDIGCAGGKLVADVIKSGNIAIGIEGSNYCLLRERFEWGNPESAPYLFTADVTKEFILKTNGDIAQFDIVTLWEVVEHISQEDFSVVIDNIKKHLKPHGIIVMSINIRKHEWHNKSWNYSEIVKWFSERGFQVIEIFNQDEYVRRLFRAFYLTVRLKR